MLEMHSCVNTRTHLLQAILPLVADLTKWSRNVGKITNQCFFSENYVSKADRQSEMFFLMSRNYVWEVVAPFVCLLSGNFRELFVFNNTH